MNLRQFLAELGDTSIVELAVIAAGIIGAVIGITMVWPQLF